jgi:hypothetical protein
VLRLLKLAVMAVALVAIGVGASAAFGSTGSHSDVQPAGGPSELTAPSELHYVSIAPCTLVDTRVTGGPFANGASRNYKARGNGSLASQGGSAAGCKIDNDARAIVVNVGSLSPTGAGFVKAKAFGSAGGGAGAVNYAAHQNIGGVLNLNLAAPGVTPAFTLINTGGPTGVLVTVTGYYIGPMAVHVLSNGLLSAASRVANAGHPVAGAYTITFDRDVSKCVYTATPVNVRATIFVQPQGGQPNSVVVNTFAEATGTQADLEFNLVVQC